MSGIEVSINMITYNRGRYLSEAIESVLSQSFQDWELVIVDDGSTDNTEELIKKYQENDERIKYIRNNKNFGIVKSRNKALENSLGQYIAVLDSDDVWCDKDKLSKQLKALEKESCILVGGGVIEINKDGEDNKCYLNNESDRQIRRKILFRNPFAHSSVMYRKDLALELGGYKKDFLIGEDYDLFLRLGLRGKMKNIKDYLVKYRVHSDNECKKKRLEALKCNLKIIKQYRNKYPNFYLAYIRRILRLGIGYLLFK